MESSEEHYYYRVWNSNCAPRYRQFSTTWLGSEILIYRHKLDINSRLTRTIHRNNQRFVYDTQANSKVTTKFWNKLLNMNGIKLAIVSHDRIVLAIWWFCRLPGWIICFFQHKKNKYNSISLFLYIYKKSQL